MKYLLVMVSALLALPLPSHSILNSVVILDTVNDVCPGVDRVHARVNNQFEVFYYESDEQPNGEQGPSECVLQDYDHRSQELFDFGLWDEETCLQHPAPSCESRS